MRQIREISDRKSSKSYVKWRFLFAKIQKIYTICMFLYIFYFLDFMAQVVRNDFTFTILDELEVKYPELIELILGSESIDNNEKQYWFDILPSMTDEQIDRLFNILMTEQQQLEELNLKYQEEIKTLNEKHLIEWQSLQSKKAKQQIQQAEAKDTSKEEAQDVL